MAGRVGRIAAATAVVAATGTGAAMIGVGMADAANPLIAGKCGTTMSGHPGQAVMLNTASATGGAGPVMALGTVPQSGSQTFSVPTSQLGGLVSSLPLLGGTLNNLLGSSCDVTVTAVNSASAPVRHTTSPGTGTSGGGLLSPVTDLVGGTVNGLLGGRSDAGTANPQTPQTPQLPVASGSGGTAPGAGASASKSAPKHNTSSPSARPSGGSGLPFGQVPSIAGLGNFSKFSNVLSPSALYGNLPFVTSGMFRANGADFGNQIPGFSPQFGLLGENSLGENSLGQNSLGQGNTGQNSNTSDLVQNAGKAEALDTHNTGNPGNNVGLPLLVAVLALSGVTASLVRIWVLRRTS